MRIAFQCLTRQFLSNPCQIYTRARVTAIMASSFTTTTSGKSDVVPSTKVNHCSAKHQFYIDLDPPNRAVLDYEVVTNDTVDLYHTGVPVDYRGHGIAAELAKAAFSHFTSSGTKMLVTCTYLQKYYHEHPDASRADLVTLPGQA